MASLADIRGEIVRNLAATGYFCRRGCTPLTADDLDGFAGVADASADADALAYARALLTTCSDEELRVLGSADAAATTVTAPSGPTMAVCSTSLTRAAAAAHVARMFFCATVPPPWHDLDDNCSFACWHLSAARPAAAYLRSALTYFDALRRCDGSWLALPVQFARYSLLPEAASGSVAAAVLAACSAPVRPLHVSLDGGISDHPGATVEVDFANHHVGFGAWGTQEEKLMGASPELTLATLLCPPLEAGQVLVTTGAVPAAVLSGHGASVAYARPHAALARLAAPVAQASAPATSAAMAPAPAASAGGGVAASDAASDAPDALDAESRAVVHRCVVAMDAADLSMIEDDEEGAAGGGGGATAAASVGIAGLRRLRAELSPATLDRDCRKLLCAMQASQYAWSQLRAGASAPAGGASGGSSLPDASPAKPGLECVVSSGWWGCGAFGGTRLWKALLQWVAASAAGCALKLNVVGDAERADMLTGIVEAVGEAALTVGGVFRVMQQAAAALCDADSGAAWLQAPRDNASAAAAVAPVDARVQFEAKLHRALLSACAAATGGDTAKSAA